MEIRSRPVARLGMMFKYSSWPAAGVLKFKRQAEELLEQSGLPYTIIRPARLTDGTHRRLM